jgi:hypothetical protein
MKTITTLYTVAFFDFSHKFLGAFAHIFIIYIFRFFLLDFLKIVFILREVQALKGKCYSTKVFT